MSLPDRGDYYAERPDPPDPDFDPVEDRIEYNYGTEPPF